MTAVKIADHPPGTTQWHALRTGHLGASDAGTLCGNGFLTWNELLAEKAWPAERPATPAQARGNWLEPALVAYAAHRGHTADTAWHGTWENADYPGWRVNPDGVTADGVLIEAKSTSWRDPQLWGRGGSDQIPPRLSRAGDHAVRGARPRPLGVASGGDEANPRQHARPVHV